MINLETLTFIYQILVGIWYLFALLLILYLYFHNSIPHKVKIEKQDLKPSSNLEAGELSILMYRKIEPQVLSVTILNLIKKGVIILKKIDSDYQFEIVNLSGRMKLARSENVIKEFLLSIGKDNIFTLTEFKNYCGSKRGDTEFLFQFDLWKNVLRKESSTKQFFENKKGYGMVKLMKNFGTLLFLTNFIGGYHTITGYVLILPALLLPLFFSKLYKRTKFYHEEYIRWMNFKDDLEHLSDQDLSIDMIGCAIVLKKMDGLYKHKPDDKNIEFAYELNRAVMKCYHHAYLNGNRSIYGISNK